MSETTAPPESSADSPTRAPRTHLAWALAATVLCFLPLGLVAVYYGLRVNSAVAGGRTADALRASRAGRRWLIATIVVGALLYLVLGSVFALLGAFST